MLTDVQIAEAARPRPIAEIGGEDRPGPRGTGPLRALQGEGQPGVDLLARAGRGPTGPRHRHHAHRRRRREDDRLRGSRRRAAPGRHERRALHPRAEPRAGVRRQGGRRGWRVLPGDPDGRHQPPLHRGPARDHLGARAPLGGARQPPAAGEPAGDRPAPDHVAARRGHERPSPAEHRRRARGPDQRRAARGRIHDHRRLGGDGDLLPRREPRGSGGAAKQHHRRI